MLDIDRFKAINDGFGHAAGDRVLKEVAARMAANCRAGDLLGRLGGEEFLAIFVGVNAIEAQAIAERLREAVERPPICLGGGASVSATVSGGLVALAPDACAGGLSPLLERADAALYRAKAEGRNRITDG
jgi:diguanylate cyclase (GGDEF)-like protein